MRAGARGREHQVKFKRSPPGRARTERCPVHARSTKHSFQDEKLASRHWRKPVILKFSGKCVLLVVGPPSTADSFRAVGGKFEGQFEGQFEGHFEGGRRSVCDSSHSFFCEARGGWRVVANLG